MINTSGIDPGNLDALPFNQDNADIDTYLDQTADAFNAALTSDCRMSLEPELFLLELIINE